MLEAAMPKAVACTDARTYSSHPLEQKKLVQSRK